MIYCLSSWKYSFDHFKNPSEFEMEAVTWKAFHGTAQPPSGSSVHVLTAVQGYKSQTTQISCRMWSLQYAGNQRKTTFHFYLKKWTVTRVCACTVVCQKCHTVLINGKTLKALQIFREVIETFLGAKVHFPHICVTTGLCLV